MSATKDNFKSPKPTSAAKQGQSDKPTAATTNKVAKDTAKTEKKTVTIQEEPASERSGPPVSRFITDLFRTIAIEESDIERMRQELAQTRDFDQRVLFERMDLSKDGNISAQEIQKFLDGNYVKDTTLEECQDIIAEFDSNMDGTMAYDEFLNCFLPAANISLRDYCIYSKRVPSYYNEQPSLPVSVSSMAVRILEREKNMCRKRSEVRMNLFKNKEHQKLRTFQEISRGQTLITMPDLIVYLENNGFHPRTADVEAILRRCDHDADRAFTYEEFGELIDIPGQQAEVEDNGIVLQAKDGSPEKKEISEGVKGSALRKRRNSNDLDNAPKETIDESIARKEEEKRLEEARRFRKARYETISKLLKFLQDKITQSVNLENQKKLLSYHSSFDAYEFFREMDKDNNGYLTSEEFAGFFSGDEDFAGINFVDIIQAWNGPDNNDRVTAADFARGLGPYTGEPYIKPNPYSRYPAPVYRRWNDDDQKQEQSDSWRYKLKLVLFLQGQIAKREF